MLNITTGFFFSVSREDYVCVFLYVHSVLVLLCLTGIPDCSEEDLSVARALNLKWRTVLKSDADGTQTLINSEEVVTVDDDQWHAKDYDESDMNERMLKPSFHVPLLL